MILLEDSDLYAVINCLMIMDNSCLNKIWIQESIRQKFLKLTKKYLNHFKCPVHVLQLQQELLLTFNTSHKSTMSTVSIWSENIVTAKNLASCLDVYHLNCITQNLQKNLSQILLKFLFFSFREISYS